MWDDSDSESYYNPDKGDIDCLSAAVATLSRDAIFRVLMASVQAGNSSSMSTAISAAQQERQQKQQQPSASEGGQKRQRVDECNDTQQDEAFTYQAFKRVLALEVSRAQSLAYKACGEKTHLLDDYAYTLSAVEDARKLIYPNLSHACRLRMLCDLCKPMLGIESYRDPHAFDGEELLTSIDNEAADIINAAAGSLPRELIERAAKDFEPKTWERLDVWCGSTGGMRCAEQAARALQNAPE